ncbi:MAG: L-seryl-tRNA(Sec) selenium transferase, partial [Chloroflexota bacterium]
MSLRSLPSVDSVLVRSDENIKRYGRELTTKAIRAALNDFRQLLQNNNYENVEINQIYGRVDEILITWTTLSLQAVINATGVIIHTNLGRSPLSQSAIYSMNTASANYSNLEYDLISGKRGSRWSHSENILKELLNVEAALVVNNCASAVLLVLSALANRKQVIISRSQLIEIGGGFRIPDVMKQSGAKIVEIGTTNKVHLADYEAALSQTQQTERAVVMTAHKSNFKIIGFTEEPELFDIIELTHKNQSVFIDDLGSGALINTEEFGLAHEPTVQDAILAGADIVMFSGDKLVGGPQSGIIVGKKILLDKIRKHPLARVVRADKLSIAGLNATLLHYLKNEYKVEIPIWRMVSMSIDDLSKRVKKWKDELGIGEIDALL